MKAVLSKKPSEQEGSYVRHWAPNIWSDTFLSD